MCPAYVYVVDGVCVCDEVVDVCVGVIGVCPLRKKDGACTNSSV